MPQNPVAMSAMTNANERASLESYAATELQELVQLLILDVGWAPQQSAWLVACDRMQAWLYAPIPSMLSTASYGLRRWINGRLICLKA